MRRYAYGRRPPKPQGSRQFGAAFFMAATLDALGPAPPESVDYLPAVGGHFQMYDNDQIGDCVAVDTANALILRTANAAGQTIVPALPDVVSLYSAVGGYVIGREETDNGCDESEMCDYVATTGFLGHKSAAHGNVDQTNLDHLRWAQRLFGTCRLGWNLPGYAETLFDANRPWDVQTIGDQTTEGHDTALVDYRGGLLYVVSWGKVVPVTPAFFAKYLEEAHGEVFPDWVNAQGVAPSGFDLADLIAKLGAVA